MNAEGLPQKVSEMNIVVNYTRKRVFAPFSEGLFLDWRYPLIILKVSVIFVVIGRLDPSDND